MWRQNTKINSPTVVTELFQQWGVDIIVDIFPHSSKQHCYILTTTYYFTQWVEVVPLKQVNDQEVTNFLQQNIMSCFGISISLFFYNEMYFFL